MWAWLFFLTAGIGTWAAYDQVAASQRLLLLTAGLITVTVLDQLGRIDAKHTLVWGGIGCATLAALLGTLVLLPSPAPFNIREDALAAALIILLPLGGGSALWLGQRRFWLGAAVGLVVVWALAMLLLSRERSAWVALAAGILCMWILWQRFTWARRGRWPWLLDWLGIGAAVSALALYGLVITIPGFQTWLPLGNRWTVIEHLQVWRNALVLIQDYPFTGSGLGATGMVYSTYLLLHHVPYHNHVHNLFLQVAVEQGLLGLAAFLGMTAAAGVALTASWRNGTRADDGLRMMSAAALATMLCHGLLDSELYGAVLVPIQFLPFGFVLVAARIDQYVIDDRRFGRQKRASSRRLLTGGAIALAALAVAFILAFTPTVQAAFQANLGAVAQTQIELSSYSIREWWIQDEVRRSDAISLQAPIARYEAALTLDTDNGTANRRLGQIALSRGEYEVAQQYLERAYVQAPHQRIVHLLLGETLAVTGHVEQGAALWNSAAIHPSWLIQRRWWYTHIGATQRAAWLSDAIEVSERQEQVAQ